MWEEELGSFYPVPEIEFACTAKGGTNAFSVHSASTFVKVSFIRFKLECIFRISLWHSVPRSGR